MSDVAFAEGPYAMLVYRRILIFYDYHCFKPRRNQLNFTRHLRRPSEQWYHFYATFNIVQNCGDFRTSTSSVLNVFPDKSILVRLFIIFGLDRRDWLKPFTPFDVRPKQKGFPRNTFFSFY